MNLATCWFGGIGKGSLFLVRDNTDLDKALDLALYQ